MLTFVSFFLQLCFYFLLPLKLLSFSFCSKKEREKERGDEREERTSGSERSFCLISAKNENYLKNENSQPFFSSVYLCYFSIVV